MMLIHNKHTTKCSISICVFPNLGTKLICKLMLYLLWHIVRPYSWLGVGPITTIITFGAKMAAADVPHVLLLLLER